jgi:hypothetical protein
MHIAAHIAPVHAPPSEAASVSASFAVCYVWAVDCGLGISEYIPILDCLDSLLCRVHMEEVSFVA